MIGQIADDLLATGGADVFDRVGCIDEGERTAVKDGSFAAPIVLKAEVIVETGAIVCRPAALGKQQEPMGCDVPQRIDGLLPKVNGWIIGKVAAEAVHICAI